MERKQKQESAIERAREYGIDITLLESNLKRTPTQRMEILINMARCADEALKVQEKLYGKRLVSDKLSRYSTNSHTRES